MPPAPSLLFPPFRLDPTDERLWRGAQPIVLRHKTLAVLRYLVEHPDQLVTKEELLAAVWPNTVVSKGVLAESIREVRKALGDDPEAPQFVETVHGRGYRFIAPLTISPQPVPSFKFQVSSLQSTIVGREAELGHLHEWSEKALQGERQMVFITGEPGIGKTTLVDAFLAQVKASGQVHRTESKVHSLQSTIRNPQSAIPLIARGQCIEHYSASEAYLPVLEALEHLCRSPERKRVMGTLRQHAPLWLAQLPSALTAPEREALQRQVVGATPERMLREMARALEELTVEQPLVLWLEDLHGSDYATLDLLAFLARRREPARLLVLGTYRPLVVRSGEHPLYAIQRELQVRGQCQELALEPLGEEAVTEYLRQRFSGEREPVYDLARMIHQRTEGNPLFMVSTVETLLGQEALNTGAELSALQELIETVHRTVPANIRQFIEQQVEHLRPEERQLLEAASVAGVEWSAAALAAGLEERVETTEQRCVELARRGQFLRVSESEEWPDGTVAGCYRFVHTLYQEALYERVTTAWRVGLHQRIAERIEQGYGTRAGEVAAELAMHYERGRDAVRAVRYLHLAGETALRRHAHREAEAFLTRGIALLQTLPETAERRQQELSLHLALGPALSMTRGYADPEVERVYMRARELCRQVGETPQLFPVLQGLWIFALARAEYQPARELGEQLLRLAQSVHDPTLLLEAHQAVGVTLHFVGEFAEAQTHVEQGTAFYDPAQHHSIALLYANDPGVMCLTIAAWVLWLRGYPDQALTRAEEALTLARTLSHPLSLGVALFGCSLVSQHCGRQGQAAQHSIEEAMALSIAQGFPLLLAVGLILQGALLVRQGQSEAGIEQMKQGLATFEATGAEALRTYFLALLAEAYSVAGQPEEGLVVVAEALQAVNKTGERFYEVELWRLKGQLTLAGARG
ncbi:MAG: AAA family ATPase [Candidatus Binatia bacterium]